MPMLFAVHNNNSVSALKGQLGKDEDGSPIMVPTTEEAAAAFVEMYPKVHIFADTFGVFDE